jgi:hypothetical protein
MSSNKNEFNLELSLREKVFSLREFETFLILLGHDGGERGAIKNFIDEKFQLNSRTKGYDYINELCKKGDKNVAYKKTAIENHKNVTRIFVKQEARRAYEKFILPTISNPKIATADLIKEIREINSRSSTREKFKSYTETLIAQFKALIENTSATAIKNKRFQKRIEDTIWGYFRAEMLKYEFWNVG